MTTNQLDEKRRENANFVPSFRTLRLQFNSNFIMTMSLSSKIGIMLNASDKVYFRYIVCELQILLFERVRYTCLINKIRKENRKSIKHL